MDRLYSLIAAIAVVAAATGCDERAEAQAPTARKSRVNAVAAKAPPSAPEPDSFCDAWIEPSEATQFAFPKMDQPAPGATDGWRWVNVWATWCKPCVEEMPRLLEWEKRLADDGLGAVTFLSADETAEPVEKFVKEHPDLDVGGLRVDKEPFNEWLAATGFDPNSPLPLHVFVDPEGRVRCLRAAGVSESEFAAVERLVAQ